MIISFQNIKYFKVGEKSTGKHMIQKSNSEILEINGVPIEILSEKSFFVWRYVQQGSYNSRGVQLY